MSPGEWIITLLEAKSDEALTQFDGKPRPMTSDADEIERAVLHLAQEYPEFIELGYVETDKDGGLKISRAIKTAWLEEKPHIARVVKELGLEWWYE